MSKHPDLCKHSLSAAACQHRQQKVGISKPCKNLPSSHPVPEAFRLDCTVYKSQAPTCLTSRGGSKLYSTVDLVSCDPFPMQPL